MSKSMIETLHEDARALPLEQLGIGVPLHVLTGEATDVAAFFQRYFKAERAPKTKQILRPGLESVGKDRLSPQTGKRIVLLVDEVQTAQTEYQLAAEAPQGDEDVARGRFVVSEITAALEFLFDDGVEDERDAQLLVVRRANEDTSSSDALASALADYAGLAKAYRDELDGFGDFDIELVDEAKALAKTLRDRSATKAKGQAKAKATAALEWRNRLATLLAQEVSLVRKTARFVFRHHPQIRREASSDYERRSRAARRRSTANGDDTGSGPPPK